ncbi:MAG: ABC transporter permease [Spirochaetales bacterium]|nr:ABC transporter permease [Spirochaetales bacterium]
MKDLIMNKIGLPRLIITSLFLGVFFLGAALGLPVAQQITDIIKRMGMYGILVLAMVPSIQSGTGPNFALPIGIITGLLGIVISLEIGMTGFSGLVGAVLISLPFAVIVGYFYGRLLNVVKGAEMTIATYTGFAAVSAMCIFWIILPFQSGTMKWPLGKGLRNTFPLDNSYGLILNDFLAFEIFGVHIPTGLLLTFFGACFLVYLFTKSKVGTETLAGGMNPNFAKASGVNIDRNRIVANIISTVLGAVGIIVYSQSFGFVQLYLAPLMMAFPAVASILIGGATAQRAKVSHVIIGVTLFQGLLAVALPVANEVFPEGNLSEIIRMVVQNGIILYALTKVNSNGK